MTFTGTPPALLTVRILRVVGRHPSTALTALRWLARTSHRVGPLRLARHLMRVHPVTFVMHQFMDADVVAPAWEMMQRGEQAEEPRLRETQERLTACHYAMAHPEDGTLVPACVQHAVLDPAENAALRTLLPIVEVRTTVRHTPDASPKVT
ncbi:hypothetical protein EES40_09710 [Streptomyces sp. ADI93-02]|nr:hypothetical protein EES40_09710 [Streptomyces sp. ADI93-02]